MSPSFGSSLPHAGFSAVRHILLATDDSAMADSLRYTLNLESPELAVDHFRSRQQAIEQLSNIPYGAIVSSAKLAHDDDFALMLRGQAAQPLAPLIVMAGVADANMARAVLNRGAFDLITKPLNTLDAMTTIRFAMWENQLLRMLAARERALAHYRRHMASFPQDVRTEESFKETLCLVEQAFASFPRTVQLVDDGLECFSLLASSAKSARNQEAIKRLTALCERGQRDDSV